MAQKEAKVLKMQRPKTKYLAIQDDISGEFDALIRLNNKKEGGWFKMFQAALDWLSKQKITGEQYKVMLYLFSKLDFDNYIKVSQKELAAELDMKDANVSRAIRKLRELDIIFEAPRMGKYKLYRLNPYIGRKGNRNQEEVIIDYEEAKQQRKTKK